MSDEQPISKTHAVIIQGIPKLLGILFQFIFLHFVYAWLLTQYDAYVAAMSYTAFLGLLDFGLPGATQRELSRALALGDLQRMSSLFAYARRMHALFAGLAVLAAALFAMAYEHAWRTKPNDPHGWLILFCGVQAALMIFASPAISIANATERFKQVALVSLITSISLPLLGLAAMMVARRPESLGVSTMLAGIVTCSLAYWIATPRYLPPPIPLERDDRRALHGLGARGYANTVSFVVGNNGDKVMVQNAGVAGSLGSYDLAGRIPLQIYQVIFPITTTVYPELTRLATVDEEGFHRAIERNVRFALAFGCSFLLVPCAFSASLLTFWLHGQFVQANPGAVLVMPFMALYRALEIAFGVMTTSYYARGKPQYALPFTVFNAGVTVFATVPMYHWLGIAGVGLMNAGIDLLQIVPMALALRKFAAPRINFSELVKGFFWVLVVTGSLFSVCRFLLDEPLSHRAPLIGCMLAPTAAFLAMSTLTTLRLCPVPQRIGARLRKLPLGRYFVPS